MKYDKSSRAENPMMDALKAIVLGACFGAVFCMIGLIACALVFMGAKSIPLSDDSANRIGDLRIRRFAQWVSLCSDIQEKRAVVWLFSRSASLFTDAAG